MFPLARVPADRRLLLTTLCGALAFAIVTRFTGLSIETSTGVAIVDTAVSLISALAAFVFLERLRTSHSRSDLTVTIALATLGLANLLLAAFPGVVGTHRLPSALQLTIAVLSGVASVILVRRSLGGEDDGLQRALAAGAAVLALAYLDDLLAPVLSDNQLYAGDLLKLSAFLLVLYGCVLEFHALQRKLARRVAVDERRRMARDMHDGLAQELAFIATHSQRLRNSGEDASTVAHLQSAAERALHDSRTTIAVLTASPDIALDQLILRTADSFRSRFGVEVSLQLDHDVPVDAEGRNALLRILHEAFVNAARHGSADRVTVRLALDRHAGGCSLRIEDNGSGFDVGAAARAGRGLGLTSMQERATLLGGKLSITSTPGTGTIVEVSLP